MSLDRIVEFGIPLYLIALIGSVVFKAVFNHKLKGLRLPKYSNIYFVFLFLFIISILWSQNQKLSFYYFQLYASGYLFWFVAYNFKDKLLKFDRLLIVFGIILGILSVLNLLFGNPNDFNPFSLTKFAVAPLHHHHIGDLWAVVLIILAFKLNNVSSKFRSQNFKFQISNFKIKIPSILLTTHYLLLVFFGLSLLTLSLSRSAYAALIAGSLYCIYKSQIPNTKFQTNIKFRKTYLIFYIYIFISIVLFLYASTQKSTISAHGGYVLHGFDGLLKNPFGIGVGNFRIFDPTSASAHNIVLELASGMGIFALSFVFWLYQILKDLTAKSIGGQIVYAAIFITLAANFFFDYTYLIPLMLWIWFLSLGLTQALYQN